jgi:peptide/nickel transport system substrate-binding protein
MTDSRLLMPTRRGLIGAAALGGGLLAMPSRWARAQTPPRKGGTLRFCRPDGPEMLDPNATNSFSGMEFGQMVYDNLTYIDNNGAAQPQLATAWTAEKGGLEWVVTLREGVKFHDGQDFNAASTVATIERSLDKARAGAGLGAFGPVKSVAAEGPNKVRVILTLPFGEFPLVLAFRSCRMLAVKGIDDLRNTPNGTGPYVFKDFQPGASLTLERNPSYWDAANQYLDGIRMVYIRDAVGMQAALRAGQVDLITQLPIETYLIMNRVPGFKAYSTNTGDYQAIQIMATKAPFDNPKVRQAFALIPDRKAIVAAALFGQGSVGNDVTLPAGDPNLPALPQIEQDLPKAKQLLAEAGLSGLTLDFYVTSDRQPSPKLGLGFAEAAAKIGVTIHVKDLPYTEYLANVTRKMPMYISNFSGSATLYDSVYKNYHSKGIYCYSNTEVAPGLDAKLDAMISEVDPVKRKALAGECVTTIHNNNDRLVPYFRNYIGVTSTKVQGFVPPKYGIVETRGMSLSA